MNDLYWNVAMQLALVIAGLVAGGTFTVPAINFLKRVFKTTGPTTLILVNIFAVLITLALAVVEGTIAPGTITPQTWGLVMLAIIQQAAIRYRQIKDELDIDDTFLSSAKSADNPSNPYPRN